MAAAILSELASKKEIKISNLKVGSPPLYFLPGNEKQLLNYVENRFDLNRKVKCAA